MESQGNARTAGADQGAANVTEGSSVVETPSGVNDARTVAVDGDVKDSDVQAMDANGDGFLSTDEVRDAVPDVEDTVAARIAGDHGPATALGAVRFGLIEAIRVSWWVIAVGLIIALFLTVSSAMQYIFGDTTGAWESVAKVAIAGLVISVPVAATINAASAYVSGKSKGISDIFVVENIGPSLLSVLSVIALSSLVAYPVEKLLLSLIPGQSAPFVVAFIVSLALLGLMLFVSYAPWSAARGNGFADSFKETAKMASKNWLPLFIIDAIFFALSVLSVILASSVATLLALTGSENLGPAVVIGVVFLAIGLSLAMLFLAAAVLARSYAYEKMRDGEKFGAFSEPANAAGTP